jgi:hypothetical protein
MKKAERQARPIAREFSATTPTADLCVRVRVVALMLLQEGADLYPLVERRGGVGCRKDGDVLMMGPWAENSGKDCEGKSSSAMPAVCQQFEIIAIAAS